VRVLYVPEKDAHRLRMVSRSFVVAPGKRTGASSTAPSFAFERFLAQSLPTESQDAILDDEETPEAQAFG
jgi:hypothetical protein